MPVASAPLRCIPNLSMLWSECTPEERFARAALAGFAHAEMLFPQTLARDGLLRAMRESGVGLALFDTSPGDMTAGELGLLCLPGREVEFVGALDEALRLARETGTSMINVLAGVVPPGVTRGTAERVALANLRAAIGRAERAGTKLLIEAINALDAPGYLLDTVERAAWLVSSVASTSVALQLDVYHAAVNGDDPLEAFRRYEALIAHVQVADHPGRHQPGSGKLALERFFDAVRESGYSGYVGLEFKPLGDSDAAMSWLRPEDRA